MKLMEFVLCAAVTIMAAHVAVGQDSSVARDAAAPAQIGRWTAHVAHSGPVIDFDGVPLVRGGIVQLFSANGARRYYSSGSGTQTITVEPLTGGGLAYTVSYAYDGDGSRFRANQRIEVRTVGPIQFSLTARWDGAEPAALEWNAARLWSYPLQGASFDAQGLNAAPLQGRIPLRPAPGRAMQNKIAAGWSRLQIAGARIGDLSFTAEGAEPVLLDGRNDPYLQNDRVLWEGFPSVMLAPGEERVLKLTMDLSPHAAATVNAEPAPEIHVGGRARVTKSTASWSPLPAAASGDPVIVPQPKHATFSGGALSLRGRLPLTIAMPAGEAGDRAAKAAREFAAEITARTAVRWNDQPSDTAHWCGRGLLVMVADKDGVPAPLAAPSEPHAEGYALFVTERYAAVLGQDSAGAFYGLQTLRQLLRPAESRPAAGRAPARFAAAAIEDWPSLKMRAAHLFVGRNALPFHRKLIERVFSRYKLNTLVIECEYTKWKSHPELWQPYSMDPEDLRRDVGFARDHFMEPIPLINSLGHSEWIFKNGQHLDLAEDVKSPHAYDASNPDTYAFLFGVFGEAVDIFKPRYFHIGHDEVHVPSYDALGKYPARPENIAKGVTTLFMEDTNRILDWLRPQGIAPILWADMMLYRTEGDPAIGPEMVAANAPSLADAERIRRDLPKEAIVADWRYEAGSEQRNGLALCKDQGHDVLGCAWFSPENIRGWARQCIDRGALGTIQTTWAGYDSNELLLDEEYRQFTAFVLAAEYSWSGTDLHPRPVIQDSSLPESALLPYDAAEVFSASYRDGAAKRPRNRGWRLDFGSAANVALAAILDEAHLLLAPAADSAANGAAAGIGGDAPAGASTPVRGIMLAGRLQPEFLSHKDSRSAPAAVTIAVGAKATELMFTHACLCGLQDRAVAATYTITYADGTHVEAPMTYGHEIRSLDDDAGDQQFSTGRVAIPGTGDTLRTYRWRNPRPEIAIKEIRFHTDNPFASPILFEVRGN